MTETAKVDGIARASIAKINGMAVASISKIAGTQYVVLNVVPEGLIIPYNSDAAVPSGWTVYSSADNYYIIGAGSTYAVDANSSGSGGMSQVSSTAGSHTGSGSFQIPNSSGSSGSGAAGNHSHTAAWSWTPPFRNARLIKNDGDTDEIPQDGVVFNTGADAGYTNIWTGGKMFKAKAGAVGTGGSNSVADTTTSSGSHGHTGVGGTGVFDNTAYAYAAGGGHTHSITITMTNNLYQYALAAWSNAAAAISPFAGMIGMYESTTPPDGWYLCNGSNGTPDLRDYFIKTTAYGSAGSASGNGTLNASASASAAGSHQHQGSKTKFGGVSALHSTATTFGAHTWTKTGKVWLPPYYALAFIMYGG